MFYSYHLLALIIVPQICETCLVHGHGQRLSNTFWLASIDWTSAQQHGAQLRQTAASQFLATVQSYTALAWRRSLVETLLHHILPLTKRTASSAPDIGAAFSKGTTIAAQITWNVDLKTPFWTLFWESRNTLIHGHVTLVDAAQNEQRDVFSRSWMKF